MSDDLEQRQYPEDERLHRIAEDPDRRMTREEWEREESAARQAAHKKHDQVHHDREVQQKADRKRRAQNRDWRKIGKWVLIGVVVLFIIFLIGWIPHHLEANRADKLARERAKEAPQVEVVQAQRSQHPGELTVPGTTSALTEAYVYARANGYLKARYADIGDHVKKGQLLAIIDAPDLDQQVAQAREQVRQAESQEAQQQAQLNLARVTWDRWRVLVARGVFSRQDGDTRQADFEAQQAVVAAAHRNTESYRANLARILSLQEYEKVRAPFDGVITQRNTDIGALISSSGSAVTAAPNSASTPSGGSQSTGMANTSGTSGMSNQSATPTTGQSQGGPLFAIAQLDVLRILVAVPEGYASSIQHGMGAKVFVQEKPGLPISGTVTRIANSLDQNTRTMLTEVDVPNHDATLFPGMYAVVSFTQVRGTSPLIIPGDAVVIRQDRSVVATVHDQKIRMKPVEIGRDYGPVIEVVGGLQEGEWVVTTVTDRVTEGTAVRPHQSEVPGIEQKGTGGQQSNKAPAASPNEYGDQTIVNSGTEASSPKGGSQKGGGQSGGGGNKSSGGSQGKGNSQ